ncbi:collagen alpha-1(I) chain-like [Neopelma chrysocephalum]|uniref:collagen alpha-1(I) chain-like n=1 Tax=Neopelma chrysocephalum TaxID=114329 RepID=UPI000FCCEA6C|nr:collagen alpha-1(I) chain-like [Neopelma chrysocephalum]
MEPTRSIVGPVGPPGPVGPVGESPGPHRAPRTPRTPRTRRKSRSARSCGSPRREGGQGSPGPPGQPRAGRGAGRAGPPGRAGPQGHLGGGLGPPPGGAEDFSGEGFNLGNQDWALPPVASKPSCGSRPGWRSWLEGSPCWKPSSGQVTTPRPAPAPAGAPAAPPGAGTEHEGLEPPGEGQGELRDQGRAWRPSRGENHGDPLRLGKATVEILLD